MEHRAQENCKFCFFFSCTHRERKPVKRVGTEEKKPEDYCRLKKERYCFIYRASFLLDARARALQIANYLWLAQTRAALVDRDVYIPVSVCMCTCFIYEDIRISARPERSLRARVYGLSHCFIIRACFCSFEFSRV